MSRSYKQTPVLKEHTGKLNKRQANRIVRQRLKDLNTDISNGSYYKSIVESWDIRDYRFYQSEQQVIQEWTWSEAMGYTHCTKEEAIIRWRKDYINK